MLSSLWSPGFVFNFNVLNFIHADVTFIQLKFDVVPCAKLYEDEVCDL